MSEKPKPVDLEQVAVELRAVQIVTETGIVNSLTLVFPTGWQAADFPALFEILPALVAELQAARDENERLLLAVQVYAGIRPSHGLTDQQQQMLVLANRQAAAAAEGG